MTTVEQLDAAWGRVDSFQAETGDPLAQREFALAKTAIEDAIMRFNRGYARATARFQVSDLEAVDRDSGSAEQPG